MNWFAVILFLLTAVPAAAQSVRVTTGEHDGFSRLVFESPQLSGWQLSRLPDGYLFTLRSGASFDLTGVFQLIPKHRLAAIAPAADGKSLTLTLGCACHAIGFDYRPGIVVVDLRDGAPPQGSAFELTASGGTAGALAPAAMPDIPRPKPRPAGAEPALAHAGLPLPTGPAEQLTLPPVLPLPTAPALALREALAAGLAQGAAQGVVNPVDRLPPTDGAAETAKDPARIGIVALPGLSVAPAAESPPNLTAEGQVCPADERVNVADWGNPDLPLSQQMAEFSAVLGEFDRPAPDQVGRAIQRLIWLGFGAEAGLLTDTFGRNLPDASLWRGMARVLDGEHDPALARLGGCAGAAALWGALAQTETGTELVNAPALKQAFSALPPHLRQHLGQRLVTLFSDSGDAATAQALRDAMMRTAGGSGTLVDAQLALQAGDADDAAALASAALAKGGPTTTTALVTLIEAKAQSGQSVSIAEIEAVDALLTEQSDDAKLQRAAILGRALAGDFDGAFRGLQTASPDILAETSADLWAVLAKSGPKTAILTHAILPPDAEPVALPETRIALADRLVSYGFGAAALRWIGPESDDVTLASAELAAGDARAALARLAGQQDRPAVRLRAQALLDLGEAAKAALLWSENGDDADAITAWLHARDWAALRERGSEPWQAATATLAPTAPTDGQLAMGRALLDNSAATRAALTALLDETPTPSE